MQSVRCSRAVGLICPLIMRPVDMLGLAYIDRRHADSSALGALATLGGSEALRLVAGRTVGGGQRETVCRIRKQEGLQVMKTVCKRRPLWASTPTPTRAAHPHHVWSDDVVHDETTDGRRLKCLTVLDEYPREG
jgi:hypothetical protein